MKEFDLAVFKFVHLGLHRTWLDPLMFVITSSGLGGVQAAILLVVWLIQRHQGWRSPAPWALIAYAISGLASQWLKHLVIRDRPSQLPFSLPQEQIFFDSFPSGHTTTSFAIATCLLVLCPRLPKLAKLALATWPFLVGLSRVYVGVHWPTDVIGGGILGTLVGIWVAVLAKRNIATT